MRKLDINIGITDSLLLSTCDAKHRLGITIRFIGFGYESVYDSVRTRVNQSTRYTIQSSDGFMARYIDRYISQRKSHTAMA
jgi:hypothetical protein